MKKSIIGGEIKLQKKKNIKEKSTKNKVNTINSKEKPISLKYNKPNEEVLKNDIIKKWYIFKEISNDNTIKDEKWLSYLLRQDYNSLKLYKNYFSKLVPRNYDRSIFNNQKVINHIQDIKNKYKTLTSKKKIVEPRLLLQKYMEDLGINYNNNNNDNINRIQKKNEKSKENEKYARYLSKLNKNRDNRFYNKNSVRKILGESSKINENNQIKLKAIIPRNLQNKFNKENSFVISKSQAEIKKKQINSNAILARNLQKKINNEQINSNAKLARNLQKKFNNELNINQNYLLQKELQNHYNHLLALKLQNNEYKKALL